MTFLMTFGLTFEALNNLAVLLYTGTRALWELAEVRRDAITQRALLLHHTSPGGQYRLHIQNGGYRP